MRRTALLVPLLAATALTGCSQDGAVDPGLEAEDDLGDVTVQSGDATATAPPVCVEDVPADVSDCPGFPGDVGELPLATSLVATVSVPTTVAQGGWRVRIGGQPLPGGDAPIEDPVQPITVPQSAVDDPEPVLLVVEALSDADAPKALWAFRLQDPETGVEE